MKPLLVLLVTAVALGAASTAAAREIRTAGPVEALGVTAGEIAYAASTRPLCHEVRVWDTGDRGVRRYASHCFAGTSTGSGIAGVTVSQRRALWLTYTGGNIREWTLWTKTRTSQRRQIAFQARDVDGPAPFTLGSAWEGSLPYALDDTIVVLRPNGARRFTLRAPARVVALSAHTRGYAAVLANGNVLTISLDGRPVREHAFDEPVQAAVLAGPGLVAMTAGGLEIRNGTSVRKLPLPRGSRLLGFSEGIAAYGTAREVRLLRLGDGRDRLLRTLRAGYRAQLGRLGLGSASGSQVSFVAWNVVAATMR